MNDTLVEYIRDNWIFLWFNNKIFSILTRQKWEVFIQHGHRSVVWNILLFIAASSGKTWHLRVSTVAFLARNRINNNTVEYFSDQWTFHGRGCIVLIYNLAQQMREVNLYSGPYLMTWLNFKSNRDKLNKIWDGITYTFQNSNGTTGDVW